MNTKIEKKKWECWTATLIKTEVSRERLQNSKLKTLQNLSPIRNASPITINYYIFT